MSRLTGATLVFIGRSGCGKGTQAALLEKYLTEKGGEILRLGTGDFARSRAQKNTLTGRWIKSILDAGGFFPSWLASGLLLEMIEPNLISNEQVLLLDGSPRRLFEAQVLDEFMNYLHRSPVRPIYLDISEKESRRRLMARGRSDDTAEAIENRCAWFTKEVLPMLDYYGNRLITIPAEEDIASVQSKLRESLLKTKN